MSSPTNILGSDQLVHAVQMPRSVALAWVDALNGAMDEFGINTRQRVAAFIAQVAHESMRLQMTRELWGPTPSQRRYERDFHAPWPTTDGEARMPSFATNRLAYTLGNTDPGDGRRYAGQGPIQITGRGNFTRCGNALGLPLLQTPELLRAPTAGSRSAAWFFATHGCNALADAGDLVGVRKRVNGGTNGLDETLAFNKALLAELT